MVWAIVRKGVIVDQVRVDTLEELGTWLRGRHLKRTHQLVMMHVRSGEAVHTGARVAVDVVLVPLATLGGSRPV